MIGTPVHAESVQIQNLDGKPFRYTLMYPKEIFRVSPYSVKAGYDFEQCIKMIQYMLL